MSSIGNMVKSAFGGESDAARSQRHGMEREMIMQDKAVDYLKMSESLPRSLRDSALQMLGGIYGVDRPRVDDLISQIGGSAELQGSLRKSGRFYNFLQNVLKAGAENKDIDVGAMMDTFLAEPGLDLDQRTIQELRGSDFRNVLDDMMGGRYDEGGQQRLIDQARQSPLYGAIMGGQKAGEESIARHASMTGGLRSGNVQENLYDYNTRLQNQALLQSYNQQLAGIQGLSGLQTLEVPIANAYMQKGSTWGQGTVNKGMAQIGAEQDATQQLMSMAGGFAGGFGGMPAGTSFGGKMGGGFGGMFGI